MIEGTASGPMSGGSTGSILYGSILTNKIRGLESPSPAQLFNAALFNRVIAAFVLRAGGPELAAIRLAYFETAEQLERYIGLVPASGPLF